MDKNKIKLIFPIVVYRPSEVSLKGYIYDPETRVLESFSEMRIQKFLVDFPPFDINKRCYNLNCNFAGSTIEVLPRYFRFRLQSASILRAKDDFNELTSDQISRCFQETGIFFPPAPEKTYLPAQEVVFVPVSRDNCFTQKGMMSVAALKQQIAFNTGNAPLVLTPFNKGTNKLEIPSAQVAKISSHVWNHLVKIQGGLIKNPLQNRPLTWNSNLEDAPPVSVKPGLDYSSFGARLMGLNTIRSILSDEQKNQLFQSIPNGTEQEKDMIFTKIYNAILDSDSPRSTLSLAKEIYGKDATKSLINPALYKMKELGFINQRIDSNSESRWSIATLAKQLVEENKSMLDGPKLIYDDDMHNSLFETPIKAESPFYIGAEEVLRILMKVGGMSKNTAIQKLSIFLQKEFEEDDVISL
jgi:hypothetical protein